MFSLIGLGERAGSGLITIQTAWKTQHWQHPVFEELVQPDKVILTLKTIPLIPNDILDELKNQIGESFNLLTNNEILALAFASQYENVTNIDLQNYAEINSYESNKVLSNLVSKNLLTSTGSGRGMKYIINYENNHISQSNIGGNELNIGGNEQKIVEISRFAQEKQRLETNDMLNIIIKLCKVKPLSARELGNYLNRDYNWIRKEYLSKLVKENKLFLTIPDKPKSSKQKYYSKEI